VKKALFCLLGSAALLVTGCASASPLRNWFAADRTLLRCSKVPGNTVNLLVLGGGELSAEIENEFTVRLRGSKYVTSGGADAALDLVIEPLDAYGGLDDPTFGPTVAWTAIVFRATLTDRASGKAILEGVVASYKGYEPADWDPKLLKPGLRRAAIVDGVNKVVGLIETNVPKAGEEPREGGATGVTAAPQAPAPAPPPASAPPPRDGTGGLHEAGMKAGEAIDKGLEPVSDAVRPAPGGGTEHPPAPSGGKTPSPH
jgi:hypothetical protein